jgi:hypothetical protein
MILAIVCKNVPTIWHLYITHILFIFYNNYIMDPITISTLVAVTIGGILQIIQIYFDYKIAEHHQVGHIYNVYEFNCCSTIKQDSDN